MLKFIQDAIDLTQIWDRTDSPKNVMARCKENKWKRYVVKDGQTVEENASGIDVFYKLGPLLLFMVTISTIYFFQHDSPSNELVFWASGIIIGLLGIVLAIKSDDAVVSLIGGLLTSFGIGYLLAPYTGNFTELSTFFLGYIGIATMLFCNMVVRIFQSGKNTFLRKILYHHVMTGIAVGTWFVLYCLTLFEVTPFHLTPTQYMWVDALYTYIMAWIVMFDQVKMIKLIPTADNAADASIASYLNAVLLLSIFLFIFRQIKYFFTNINVEDI